MPPKRKQTDESAAEPSSSTRSTRTSTRSSTAKNTAKETASSSGTNPKKSTKKGAGKAAPGAVDGNASDGVESVHSAKKSRTSGPATTRKNATKAPTSRRGAKVDDEPNPIRKVPSTKEIPSNHVVSNREPVVEPTPAPPPPPKKTMKHEPYTPQRALELFSKYADSDDVNVIGPEGFEQLCTDANMPLDGLRPIIFAWQMGAKDMAKVTREEWVSGTTTLKVSSVSQISLAITELEELLIQGKPPVKVPAKKDQEYERTSYFTYSKNVNEAFQKLYAFSFNLAKPEGSRNIEMETSVAFWTILLVPRYSIMGEVIQFINEKGTYKATNKDLWTMMLEFCENVTPNLEGYDPEAAWPTLVDDFVAWKRSESGKDINAD